MIAADFLLSAIVKLQPYKIWKWFKSKFLHIGFKTSITTTNVSGNGGRRRLRCRKCVKSCTWAWSCHWRNHFSVSVMAESCQTAFCCRALCRVVFHYLTYPTQCLQVNAIHPSLSPVLELYHSAILNGGQFLIWGAVSDLGGSFHTLIFHCFVLIQSLCLLSASFFPLC